MPWVRFTERFLWDPPERKGRVTISYEAGSVFNVPRACATAALAAGKGTPAKKPTETEHAGG